MKSFQFNGPNGAIAIVHFDDSAPGIAQVEGCETSYDSELVRATQDHVVWSPYPNSLGHRADNPGIVLDYLLTSPLWKMSAKVRREYATFMHSRERSG